MNGFQVNRRLTGVILLVLQLCWGQRFCAAKDSGDPNQGKGEAAKASEIPAGHSTHGEAFNEGPRSAAYLMEGMGKIIFPVTSSHPLVRPFIEQGVVQLHGFWYFEAERSFRQAAAYDKECAIAYWGMAMANVKNDKRAKEFIAAAVKFKDKASERERLYIEALDGYLKADANKKKDRAEAFVKGWERVVYAAPDDLEAKAFLALQIWNSREEEVPIHSHVAVDALLETVFRSNPLHPAHHYRIHLWDNERPENAVASAAMCGQAAPGIAHMWHMGGHIFSDLKRYDDAAWQQAASARVDHAHMMRDTVLPDRIHNFAHNNEWLARNLNHLGRVRESMALSRNMIEIPRHPKYNTLGSKGSFYFGRLRYAETCIKFELWRELLEAHCGDLLMVHNETDEDLRRLGELGLAYFQCGEEEYGQAVLAELKSRRSREIAAGEAAAAQSEKAARDQKKKEDEVKNAGTSARQPHLNRAEECAKGIAACEGAMLSWHGDFGGALAKFRSAGRIEPELLDRTQFLAGETEPTLKSARERVEKNAEQVLPLATLVELLLLAGKAEEAKEKFESLRRVAGAADLDLPVLARLAPFAKQLNWPVDWRLPKSLAPDAGQRPALDSLGPPHWSPHRAAPWELTNAQGSTQSLANFHRKPVILIFFLGSGCLHCAEQLRDFAPKTEAFRQLGVDIVAISSDPQEGLAKSIENYRPNAFPFTLLSDGELHTFKAYRCFDDFEKKPLHGTFLIDGRGLVRWHDIGFEPYRNVDFLLEEARRLLAITPHLPGSLGGSAP